MTTYTTIDFPSAISTTANGINNNGEIVGTYTDSLSVQHGFLLSGGTYTTIDVGGVSGPGRFGITTVPTGIDNNGLIVGYFRLSDKKDQAFILEPDHRTEGVVAAFSLDGAETQATGINDLGWIVGGFPAVGFVFFGKFNESGFSPIEHPSADRLVGGTQVLGTSYNSATGLIYNVGVYFGSGDGRQHGFFQNWQSKTFTTIDDPRGIRSSANGINSAGQIVGQYLDSNLTDHGFLYSGGTYTTLDDPSATNGTVATGINNSGQIVGYFADSNGTKHGFLRTPPPLGGTTADMILRHEADGQYEIYGTGNDKILAVGPLGQVGSDWQFVGLGLGNDATDMLLRNTSTGAFEIYNISQNNVVNAAPLGTVGLDWQVMGLGNFSGMPDVGGMMLRNVNTGGLQVYNIANNQVTGSAFLGMVGLDWQFSGVGNFSSTGESDLLLRNSNTGGLEVYDIFHSQITNTAFIGTVGLDWQFSGVGDFSSLPGESDLLLRNSSTGALQVYNINNNRIIDSASLGTVGLEWQFAGVAPISAPDVSDLVLRNVNTGAFQVYNIANNQVTGSASLGAVGLDWHLGGLAAATGATASLDASTAQLAQAMAGFGGGAAGSLNAAPLGADASQQTFLTAPHA